MPTVNPEQTCSWADRLLYGYISPVIDLSRRVNHVSVDDMPSLLDSDKLAVLRSHAFPVQFFPIFVSIIETLTFAMPVFGHLFWCETQAYIFRSAARIL